MAVDDGALEAMAKLVMKTAAKVDILEKALATAVALLPRPAAETVVMQLELFVEDQSKASCDPASPKPGAYAWYQNKEAVRIAEQISAQAIRLHRPQERRTFNPEPSFRPLPEYP